jgi:hypothetical protein
MFFLLPDFRFGLILLIPVFIVLRRKLAGFERLVLLEATDILDLFLERVNFIFWLRLALRGAVHVEGFATILPLREPDVHLYLRTVLLPLRPNTVATPSVIS